ncbi:acyl-CoA dehydrogenase [Verticiella sediminum]|uniref:Acyl-CoA dehydrogenase n=1 Tax=Verticiella sediminum TaxID=1247510 RepID=A0A556AKL2_9BURK|nr:acyl-CoA dehydrogenase family protein [Verticiella sediminum]TSH93428.1 acyl-CoA dehydrogenase [Verticiella sediminum]
MARFDSRDETSILLEDSADEFLSHRFDPQRLRAQYQARSGYDRTFWAELAGQGWLALRLPEAMGGSELGIEHVAVLAHALGRHAAPDPFVACAVMPAVLATAAGSADTSSWRRIAAGQVTGKAVSTVAWQEGPFALDVGLPTTRAQRRQEGGFLLSGCKCQVVAGDWADILLVSASLDGEAALFAVQRTAPGVHVEGRLTSDGGTIATIEFRDLELPPDALLASGAPCLASLQQAVDEAMLATAAQLLGLADRAFEITLEYLRTRVQFGHPIGSFQALQHMAVDVRIGLALAAAACGAAVRLQSGQPGSTAARAAVAAAKARTSDTALLAGRFGVQAHGAIGFAAEADIGCYLKSAIRLAAWLGNGTQQRLRVARITDAKAEHLKDGA